MQITITANSLKELQEIMDTLVILDEAIEEKPAAGEKKKRERRKRIDRVEVQKMIEEGYSNKEISDILGVGYSSICYVAKELQDQ